MDSPSSRFPAPRRVFTAPVSSSYSSPPQPPASSPSQGGSVETLYNHPNAKIIAFTASARTVPRSPSSQGPSAEDGQGTLSWSSQLERTIAVGSFRIYRAPGSVAFLNCGSALQPILPKSQCWCIEEDSSKFVLQIRKPQYWRIELPVAEYEDKQRALLLRDILDQILLFEKTPCPFQRSFTVHLPEPPKTPVRKKPWTPVRRSLGHSILPGSPEVSPTPKSSVSHITAPLKRESPFVPAKNAHIPQSSEPSKPITLSDATPNKTERETGQEPETTDRGHDAESTSDEPLVKEPKDRPDNPTETNGNGIQVDSETKNDEVEHDTIETPTEPKTPFALSEDVAPRVETPVKVKEVVSAIEVRIAEEPPTPSTAIEPTVELPPHSVSPTPVSETSASIILPKCQDAVAIARPVKAVGATCKYDASEAKILPDYTPVDYGRLSTSPTEDVESIHETHEKEDRDDVVWVDASSNLETIEEAADLMASEVIDEVHEGSGIGRNTLAKRKLRRYGGFGGARSATAPPHLTLVTSPPTQLARESSPVPHGAQPTESDAAEKPGAVSPSGSSDSFHSVKAWHSPVTPPATSNPDAQSKRQQTFPYPHDNIVMPDQPFHHRDISDLTVTPDTRCTTWDTMSMTSSSGVSQLSAITAPDPSLRAVEECCKSTTSEDGACYTTGARAGRSALRHRSTASISTNRGLSPLPPAATLFSPQQSRKIARSGAERPSQGTRLDMIRRMPLAIVSKTCEVLLGPPAYLVTLMLKVASKISAGEWRGLVLGFGEGGEKIPVQWDYSDGDLGSVSESDEEAEYVTPPTGREDSGDETGGGGDGDAAGAGGDEDDDDPGRTWGVD